MRNVVPVPSLALGACLVTLLSGCAFRGGRVSARWVVDSAPWRFSGPASGAWCGASRTILVQGTDGDRVVGFVWRYDSLRPDSAAIGTPAPADSPAVGSSAALRFMKDGELLGFRSVSGTLRVTAVDTTMIDARLAAKLQRVGRTDSTEMTAEFHRIRLVPDTTLCTP